MQPLKPCLTQRAIEKQCITQFLTIKRLNSVAVGWKSYNFEQFNMCTCDFYSDGGIDRKLNSEKILS